MVGAAVALGAILVGSGAEPAAADPPPASQIINPPGNHFNMGFGLENSKSDLLQLDSHDPDNFSRNDDPYTNRVAEYLDEDHARWVNVGTKWCSLDGNPAENQHVKDWVDRAAANDKNTLITIRYSAPKAVQPGPVDQRKDCEHTGDQELPAPRDSDDPSVDDAFKSMKRTVKGLHDCLAGVAGVTCDGPPELDHVAVEIGPETNFPGNCDPSDGIDATDETVSRTDALFFWDLVNWTAFSSQQYNWEFGGGIGLGAVSFRRITGQLNDWGGCSIAGRNYLQAMINGPRDDAQWKDKHLGPTYLDAYAIHKGHCDENSLRTMWTPDANSVDCERSISDAVSNFKDELADDNQNKPLWFTGLIPTETDHPPSEDTQRQDAFEIWNHLRNNYSCKPLAFSLVIWTNLADRDTADGFGKIGFRTGPVFPYDPKEVATAAEDWSHVPCPTG